MGCGSSAQQSAAEPDPALNRRVSIKSQSTKDFDDLMGKNIPRQMIQPDIKRRKSAADEEATKGEQNQQPEQQAPPPPPPEEVLRVPKKAQKKYRGGDDVNQQIYENVTRSDREQRTSDVELIRKSFEKHVVFYSLPREQVQGLIENMFYCTQAASEFIFKQGDQASSYFVIHKGQVEIIINGKVVKTLKEGDYFGEIALLYNATRSASVKTVSDCGFWSLDRHTFKKTIEELTIKEYDENRKFIDQVPFFSFMTVDQRDSIAHALITAKFSPGEAIVNEGDQADSFYVIKSGEVSVWKGSKEIRKMGAKDSFGYAWHLTSEQALYEKSVRGASVKADTEVKCVTLGRENLTKILGDKVQIIVFSNLMRWSFEKSEVLKQLTKIQLEKIAQRAKIDNYKNGQIILEKNQPCDKLVVVLEGVITNVKQEPVTKGLCYGDQFLRKENYGQKLDADYYMVGDGVLATIPFAALFKIFGGDLETVLKRNENSHEKKIQQLGARADHSHIRVEDLYLIKKLGQGQFGWVYLVKHKDQDKCYALKSVSKASIVEQNLEKHILTEKQVLEQCNFPFIMQFYRTFKDEISIYFLVEYIRGMELFDVIREIGLLQKYDTQFYIGTIILALEYLHSQKCIVYRDLKPENLMVNDQGYMSLIDLGTAKPLAKQRAYRAYTIIGTPHYMAPEIILGKGYSFSVDLWSMGVCMFEFICGGVPYADELEDPYEIYEEIMNTQLKFPTFIRDRQAKKLIEQLLSKQPETRLGASFSALKANPWFDDFDFDKLFSRELKAPFIPQKDKIILEAEVQKRFQMARPVVNEIKQEQQELKIRYRKELAKDTNWDKEF